MGASRPRKVLLLDDRELGIDPERTFLQRPELSLITGPSDEGSLDRVRREAPDLLVLDLSAANRSALKTCRRVKADPALARIPVLLVTTSTLRDDAEGSGADAVVYKPLVRREYLDAVRRLLGLSGRTGARCPVSLRFLCGFPDGEGAAFSRDLSERGAYLRADRAPECGARLAIRFRLPGDGEIACEGVVRSRREAGEGPDAEAGFGVEFESMRADDRERLRRFVEERLARPVGLP